MGWTGFLRNLQFLSNPYTQCAAFIKSSLDMFAAAVIHWTHIPGRYADMKKRRVVLVCLFALYLILLVWLIVFKGMLPYKGMVVRRSLNLIPFYVNPYESYYRDIAVRDWIVNVAAFIPFGICAAILYGRKSLIPPVLAGFGLSLLFEIVQYAAGLGASDVTDLITNTAGALAGVLLYRLLLKLFGEDRATVIVNVAGILLGAGFILFASVVYLFSR